MNFDPEHTGPTGNEFVFTAPDDRMPMYGLPVPGLIDVLLLLLLLVAARQRPGGERAVDVRLPALQAPATAGHATPSATIVLHADGRLQLQGRLVDFNGLAARLRTWRTGAILPGTEPVLHVRADADVGHAQRLRLEQAVREAGIHQLSYVIRRKETHP